MLKHGPEGGDDIYKWWLNQEKGNETEKIYKKGFNLNVEFFLKNEKQI